MVKKLIRCAFCNQVIPNYSGDELAQSLSGIEWSDADLGSAKEFLRTHSGHPLEELSVEGDSCISEKPSFEPLGVAYFLAHNGDRKFLIRRTKTALDLPASYEIISGRLKISNVSLKIQEEDLRKQINAEKGFSLLLKRKMEKFIEAFREETAGIKAEDFEREAEAVEEGEHSLIAYGSFKESHWARILKRCGRYFKESELKIVRDFIEENRIPPDVLSVQIQRRISIIAPAKVESTERTHKRDKIGMGTVEAESVDEFFQNKSAKTLKP